MTPSKAGPPKNGRRGNIHIGTERYSKLTGIAIEISYQVGDQVTPTQIAQYLVDHYSDMAKSEILRELHVPQVEKKES
ncbi:TPA: hypothetical protein ACNRRD_005907 [Pseudomonas aeruginosa]|nr:hypothetical protein [Pseudomonas aeruginosa]MCD2777487.1 hypothetical protein [Pseudomonas aeruginosa]MCD2858439.1 hypothetical protein [Pseudomonas aeruginosa]MCD2916766.1 hypothetical protein [Pseudomonas aeruginosa]MCD2929027.1 hypothetical protein [Pseudomonas aeruginosa]MCD2969635.1 hypothetical protein [Pseudomonas aeruginosa]